MERVNSWSLNLQGATKSVDEVKVHRAAITIMASTVQSWLDACPRRQQYVDKLWVPPARVMNRLKTKMQMSFSRERVSPDAMPCCGELRVRVVIVFHSKLLWRLTLTGRAVAFGFSLPTSSPPRRAISRLRAGQRGLATQRDFWKAMKGSLVQWHFTKAHPTRRVIRSSGQKKCSRFYWIQVTVTSC